MTEEYMVVGGGMGHGRLEPKPRRVVKKAPADVIIADFDERLKRISDKYSRVDNVILYDGEKVADISWSAPSKGFEGSRIEVEVTSERDFIHLDALRDGVTKVREKISVG